MLPALTSTGAPLLAPVLQPFPVDPAATYDLNTAGNETPSVLDVGADATHSLYLYYCHRDNGGDLALQGTPSIWLSREDHLGNWLTPAPCRFITAAGTLALGLVNPDIAHASDGSPALWMIAQQWLGPESGDLKLFYSTPADGAAYGIDWHAWDGADGVLVTTTSNDVNQGQYNLDTPTILDVGNGTIAIGDSTPTQYLPPSPFLPIDWAQVQQTLVLQGAAIPCFVAGTRLLTRHGEVPVEALRVGDMMPALCGRRLARVRWIGRRDVVPRFHPAPADVLPVRIAAGAFGPGRPRRDLWLSPDHAVLLGDALIPIRYLLNGTTLEQRPAARVSYWHVELEAHDVLFAEGLAVESYLDTGNRTQFSGGTGAGAAAAARSWDEAACAPLLTGGAALAAARRALFARAERPGWQATGDSARQV